MREGDERQIAADTARSQVAEISTDSERLGLLLRAWCVLHPEIGYSQSMNFVAAVTLHVCDNCVAEAFLLFVALMECVPLEDFYAERPPLRGFQIEVEVLLVLLEERQPVRSGCTPAAPASFLVPRRAQTAPSGSTRAREAQLCHRPLGR